MKLSATYIQKRAAAIDANYALAELIGKDSRDFTAEEQKTFDENKALIKSLDAKIDDALELEAHKDALDKPNARLTRENTKANTTDLKERVQDDPKRGFKSLGDFASAVHNVAHGGAASEALRVLAAAGDPTNQQAVAADGGYLVPPSYSNTIWEGLTKEADVLSQMCDVYNIPYGVESVTFPADAEVSRADGSRAGGIQGFWKGELTQMTSTKPTFRDVKLEPQELYVFAYVTDKLLRNSSVLAQYLTKKATDEIKFKLNNAIVNGTGVGQPKGVRVSASRVAVTKETGQAADTIVAKNVQKMWQRTLAISQKRGVWLYDNSIFEQLSGLKLDIGTAGIPLYMPPGGLSGAPYGSIFGRPAMPIEYAPALGDEGDLMFLDLQAYALGLRGGVDTQMSMHLKFDHAQTAFRFIFEADGQSWLNSAITPFTPAGTTTKTETLSPFTMIAARA